MAIKSAPACSYFLPRCLSHSSSMGDAFMFKTLIVIAATLTLIGTPAPARTHHSPAGPSLVVPAAAARPMKRITRYDGVWSVVIQTTRGDCPAAIRASVQILRGRLSAEDRIYEVNGRVASGGAIHVNVSSGGHSAGGSGRLRRDTGWGLWRTSSGECAGRWTAERRSPVAAMP